MPRYIAKAENGKGYIYDTEYSDKVPVAVETTYEFAKQQADKFNADNDYALFPFVED